LCGRHGVEGSQMEEGLIPNPGLLGVLEGGQAAGKDSLHQLGDVTRRDADVSDGRSDDRESGNASFISDIQ